MYGEGIQSHDIIISSVVPDEFIACSIDAVGWLQQKHFCKGLGLSDRLPARHAECSRSSPQYLQLRDTMEGDVKDFFLRPGRVTARLSRQYDLDKV